MEDLRRRLNRAYVRMLADREHRRRVPQRPLVLADHWSGSVQQFYHFLLGYLAPLSLWTARHGVTQIAVRDCGPMNTWFEAIAPRLDVEVLSTNAALGRMIRHRRTVTVLDGMDDPLGFSARRLAAARSTMAGLVGIELDGRPVSELGGVLVVDRASSEDFYRSTESETEMSGSERRSTPGLADLVTGLPVRRNTRVVDLARLRPAEQVGLAARSSVLVGQHGAGLVHMLWLPAGSTVIEIQPPLVAGVHQIFAELAATLGHRYLVVPQEHVHAPVSPDVLRRAFTEAGLLTERRAQRSDAP